MRKNYEETLIIGHRGAAGLAPENTHSAFQAAVRTGIKWVETDVRPTGDGTLVLSHDYLCAGMPVNRTSHEELKEKKPDLMTLDALIGEFRESLCFNLEVKDASAFTAVGETIRCARLQARTFVSSFDHRELLRFGLSFSDIPVAPLIACRPLYLQGMLRDFEGKADKIVLNAEFCDAEMLQRCADAGFRVYLYNVHSHRQLADFPANTYSGIIVDQPDRFISIERGHYRESSGF